MADTIPSALQGQDLTEGSGGTSSGKDSSGNIWTGTPDGSGGLNWAISTPASTPPASGQQAIRYPTDQTTPSTTAAPTPQSETEAAFTDPATIADQIQSAFGTEMTAIQTQYNNLLSQQNVVNQGNLGSTGAENAVSGQGGSPSGDANISKANSTNIAANANITGEEAGAEATATQNEVNSLTGQENTTNTNALNIQTQKTSTAMSTIASMAPNTSLNSLDEATYDQLLQDSGLTPDEFASVWSSAAATGQAPTTQVIKGADGTNYMVYQNKTTGEIIKTVQINTGTTISTADQTKIQAITGYNATAMNTFLQNYAANGVQAIQSSGLTPSQQTQVQQILQGVSPSQVTPSTSDISTINNLLQQAGGGGPVPITDWQNALQQWESLGHDENSFNQQFSKYAPKAATGSAKTSALTSSLTSSISSALKTNNAFGSDGLVSPQTYEWMATNWANNGGSAADFALNFPIGQYLSPGSQTAYKALVGKSTAAAPATIPGVGQ